MSHVPPPIALYSPRLIRLVTGIVTCPACHRKCFKSHLQSGWGFQTCEHSRCDTEWWGIALQPDCHGGYLAAVLGERDAAYLITRCWPEYAADSPPHLWYAALNPGNETAWIQVAVRPRERHLYRTAKIAEYLPLLLRSAA